MGGIFTKHGKDEAEKPADREPRRLFALDFDCTILDNDTLSALVTCVQQTNIDGKQPIPQEILDALNKMPDEQYAQLLMDYIIKHGGSLDSIRRQLKSMHLVNGMEHMLTRLMVSMKVPPGSHFIIISGTFDWFIEEILHNISNTQNHIKPNAIIANHATRAGTTPDKLIFKPHEHQTDCHLCPKNLCKGKALLKYIEEHGPFEQHIYVGDGLNDYCPATKLLATDILFVRTGYALARVIKEGFYFEHKVNIKAKIVPFHTAKYILENLLLDRAKIYKIRTEATLARAAAKGNNK